jgi:hypothetical protein
MPIPLLIPLIIAGVAALTKAGTEGYKAYKEDEYNDKVEGYNKESERKSTLAAQRAAIGRALKSKWEFMPQPGDPVPEKPNLTAANIIGGVADVAGTAASMYSNYKLANPLSGEAGDRISAAKKLLKLPDKYTKYGWGD